MAPLLSDVGATIVGAMLPKTTLAALKLKPLSAEVAVVTVKVVVMVLLA